MGYYSILPSFSGAACASYVETNAKIAKYGPDTDLSKMRKEEYGKFLGAMRARRSRANKKMDHVNVSKSISLEDLEDSTNEDSTNGALDDEGIMHEW